MDSPRDFRSALSTTTVIQFPRSSSDPQLVLAMTNYQKNCNRQIGHFHVCVIRDGFRSLFIALELNILLHHRKDLNEWRQCALTYSLSQCFVLCKKGAVELGKDTFYLEVNSIHKKMIVPQEFLSL